MTILEKTRQLEVHIAGKMANVARQLVKNRSAAREPVELVHAIVDAVEREIHSGGRGARVFPFNTIEVSIVAPSPHARARLEAIVDGNGQVRNRILERLRAAGCSVGELVVNTAYVPRAKKGWTDPEFSIDFARVAREAAEVPIVEAAAARIEITIVRGTAERRTYALTAQRIDLGRGGEVRDNRDGLIRTNDVAFVDGPDEINRSVSRQHAHVVYEQSSGHFRVHDDGSVHGTKIVRGGKTLAVACGGRGGRLRSGDEIVLGDARVRVKFEVRGVRP